MLFLDKYLNLGHMHEQHPHRQAYQQSQEETEEERRWIIGLSEDVDGIT